MFTVFHPHPPQVLRVAHSWSIHLDTPKALKILRIISIKGEDFKYFSCNKMNTQGHQGIEMDTPMDIMNCR